ncbi:hypothetical protein DCAR_0416779 [Daucus carota subsp. sativus]|uniref:Uncharacterized protein n=1 Tax=Daucus carota subsp. sativus TaxID=79200 RepID=A0A165XSM3_DAUCS|nr:hypothetical protein DCAR_0416779 [Daucus carota subsp. sativus]
MSRRDAEDEHQQVTGQFARGSQMYRITGVWEYLYRAPNSKIILKCETSILYSNVVDHLQEGGVRQHLVPTEQWCHNSNPPLSSK